MKKTVSFLFGWVVLLGSNGAAPEEVWQVCEHSDKTTDCQTVQNKKPVKTMGFSAARMSEGINYLKKHKAPLSVLIPQIYWFVEDDELIDFVDVNRESFSENMVNAQVAWMNWFKMDLEQGRKTPQITVERIVESNQIITGVYDGLEVGGYSKGSRLVLSYLDIKYLTADVISEIRKSMDNLIRAANIEGTKPWSFALEVRLKKKSPSGGYIILRIPAKSLEGMFVARSRFLDKLIENSKVGYYKSLKGKAGNYDTPSSSFLHWLDAARIYRLIMDVFPEINMSQFETTDFKLPANSDFDVIDIPDNKGRNSAQHRETCHACHDCHDCARAWTTVIPSAELEDLRKYNSLMLVHAANRRASKAMLDSALLFLNSNLSPEMTKKELLALLAEAWRQLTLAHAFLDGNGRTIRLLMNGLLMAYGLPPVTCVPDCLPYSHTHKNFRGEMEQAMELTKHPMYKTEYPDWLKKPKPPELLDQIKNL